MNNTVNNFVVPSRYIAAIQRTKQGFLLLLCRTQFEEAHLKNDSDFSWLQEKVNKLNF